MMPVIGIVSSMLVRENDLQAGLVRYFADDDYVEAVLGAGGCPVVLPLAGDRRVIKRQLDRVDGLLLIGGEDVDPLLYAEEPLPGLGQVFPGRDRYEIDILKMAASRGTPVLGICRGIQIINVAFGGSLYQDLSLYGRPVLQHAQDSRKSVPGHTVEIVPGTKLQKVLGRSEVRANSFHHQAVKGIAPGFCISAMAKDGVVEGIENRYAAILGVQWHPESLLARYPVMADLFEWLVGAAAKHV